MSQSRTITAAELAQLRARRRAAVARRRETAGIGRPLKLLILLAFLQLNLQVVIYYWLGRDLEARGDHPLLVLWLIAPVALWFWGIRDLVARGLGGRGILLLLLWVVLLVVHAVVLAADEGVILGLAGFLSWGAWVGMYIAGRNDTRNGLPDFVAHLFTLGGVLNAVPLMFEVATGHVIFRSTTNARVTRMYGISQSVSVVGLQLAVGCLSTFYISVNRPRWQSRVIVPLFVIQAAALVTSTSRGPVLFLLFVLAWTGLLLRTSPVKKWLTLGTMMAAAVVGGAVFARQHATAGAYVEFVLLAVSGGDTGNALRLQLYAMAWDMLFRADVVTMLFGYGAGRLSQIAHHLGGVELGIESSMLKIMLECGVVGFLLFLGAVGAVLLRAIKLIPTAVNRQVVPLIAICVIILLESAVHESLKSWIVASYLWAALTALASACATAPRRATAGQPSEHAGDAG